MPTWLIAAEFTLEAGCLVLLGFIAIRLARVTSRPKVVKPFSKEDVQAAFEEETEAWDL